MHLVRDYVFLRREVAARMGFPDYEQGDPEYIGVLCVEDAQPGERFTRVGDAGFVHMMVEARHRGLLGDLDIPGDHLPLIIPGWPLEWSL